MFFSIIIPVFNRPEEIAELLGSLSLSTFNNNFEIIIIEDGSTERCETICDTFSEKLTISYYYKSNSGPGDSRNYGMKKAKGDYYIILDSDCIIPPYYLTHVANELETHFVDCFGGSDKAHKSFSKIQKAINFAMTSFLTTGGIRGGSEAIDTFQPRSFNMGISKKAFLATNGFGNIHPGEDPDLTLRLWKLGFKTRLFKNCFVYHKRRIDWDKFENQVSKFGKVRPILDKWHPEYSKITYWFPSIFIIGLFLSIFLLIFAIDLPLKLYFIYFIIIFVVSSIQNKNLIIGLFSVIAVWKQFYGYGLGFLKSFFEIRILKKEPQIVFPELFFEKSNTTTKIIGLTGGIGSGKTTIANYLISKGIPVYVSDNEAKKVMEIPEVVAIIANSLGNQILNTDTSINREKLSELVFKDPEKLKLLNSIVHPEVKKNYEKWLVEHKNYLFVVKETAILFESGSYKDCDIIITITTPLETRIQRVINRDKTTREKVLIRIKNQISDEERNSKSDYCIDNTNIEAAKLQIDEILKKVAIQ
jgi:dephospho-CoA kinase